MLTTAHSSSSLLALTVLAINSEIVAKLCNSQKTPHHRDVYGLVYAASPTTGCDTFIVQCNNKITKGIELFIKGKFISHIKLYKTSTV